MKTSKVVAVCLVLLAVALTAIGGFADAYRGRADGAPVFVITKQHAWHDGMFLLLLALFLVVAF
jgi:hypothetical protein